MEPAHASWASQIVSAPKKHELKHFSVDYRRPNALTDKDQYSIRRIDECLYDHQILVSDRPNGQISGIFRKKGIFSMLNANSRNVPIRTNHWDKDKTTVSLHHGLCIFLRMRFCLKMRLASSGAWWTLYNQQSSVNWPSCTGTILPFSRSSPDNIWTTYRLYWDTYREPVYLLKLKSISFSRVAANFEVTLYSLEELLYQQ